MDDSYGTVVQWNIRNVGQEYSQSQSLKIETITRNELDTIRERWNKPWCIGGDFNVISFSETKLRGGSCFVSRITPEMSAFSDWINGLSNNTRCPHSRIGLIDMAPIGSAVQRIFLHIVKSSESSNYVQVE